MLIQHVNRTDPERVFIMVDNGEAATLPANAVVIWETTTDANGVQVIQPDTGKLWGFAGVLDVSMASATGNYTLAQSYGYRASSIVLQTDTSVAAGEPLVPVAGQNYFDSIATTTASNAAVTLQPIYGVLLASIASSAASATLSRKIFIRGM